MPYYNYEYVHVRKTVVQIECYLNPVLKYVV